MHSKISSLAAFAAVAAFIIPALAIDSHLVPIPVGSVVPEVAAESTDAAAQDATLPTDIPIPFGFPRPPPGAGSPGAAAGGTTDATTPTTYTTWCPDPTVLTWGKSTISVTTAGFITLTDCPESSTTTTTWETIKPTHHPLPHPHPRSEGEHEGEHGEEHEGKSPETTAVPTPNPPPVIVSGASKTQGGIVLGIAVEAISYAVFGL